MNSRHYTGVLLSDLWDLIAVHLPVQGVVALSDRIKQLIWDALRKTPTIAANLELLLPPAGHNPTADRVRATDMIPSAPDHPSFETVALAEAAGTVVRVRFTQHTHTHTHTHTCRCIANHAFIVFMYSETHTWFSCIPAAHGVYVFRNTHVVYTFQPHTLHCVGITGGLLRGVGPLQPGRPRQHLCPQRHPAAGTGGPGKGS